MSSPLSQEAMIDALNDILMAVQFAIQGDYAAVEQMSDRITQGEELNPGYQSFMLGACFTAIASFMMKEKDPSMALWDWASAVVLKVQFVTDVLDGIDDLPGDSNAGFVDR